MPNASSQTARAGSSSGPEQQAITSLFSALLLATVGGFLDAFLYTTHGHVFAGAMTGNSVLLGIALLGGNHNDAVHHAVPLLAFVCGVWVAELLQERLRQHVAVAGVTAEILGLLGASFLPARFPDHLYVFLISLVAAFQVTSFSKVGQDSYNSVFITGDLRTAMIAFFQALHPAKRADALRRGLEMTGIIVCFLLGAGGAVLLAPHGGNHALWAAVALLLVVLALSLRPLFHPAPITGDSSR